MKALNDYLDIILEKDGARWGYDSEKGLVTIKENAKNSKIKQINISGIEGSCLAFKMDSIKKKSRTHFLLKNSVENIHKGVDAIVFCKYQSKQYVLVCELKSGNPCGFEPQFKASQAFIDYLLSLYKRFNIGDTKKIKRINVLFTTRIKKSGINRNSPKNKKIDEHLLIEKNVRSGNSNINIRDIVLAFM